MSQHTGYLCIILSSFWGRYSAKRSKYSRHFLKKGRCNSKSAESSTFAVCLPEVICPIFSYYWTIHINLPNLMWSALSRYSYKKQPGYLRQSETEKYLDWITAERGLFCSNRCCVWQWPLCYTTSVYQPSAGCWSRALCYTY